MGSDLSAVEVVALFVAAGSVGRILGMVIDLIDRRLAGRRAKLQAYAEMERRFNAR